MKKQLYILILIMLPVLGWGQYILIEPNGNNGIISKNSTIVSSSSASVSLPESGAGTRLMWIPAKSAFRAGTVTGSQWDSSNIGTWSFATGHNSKASGPYSTAIGIESNATGYYSLAFTYGTASGNGAIAMRGGVASGGDSFAWSNLSRAIGLSSMAMGYFSESEGDYSIALGGGKALGKHSLAIGPNSKAQYLHSVAIGSGAQSTNQIAFSFGQNTVAHSYEMTALGINNDTLSNPGSKINGNLQTNPLLVVGNGTNYLTDRKNALMILRNGNMGIMNSNPSEALEVNGNGKFSGTVMASCGILSCSDIRFKSNIKPLKSSLNIIKEFNGVSYYWKNTEFPERNFNDKKQLGLIAQEVEKIIPELVETDAEGYKSVNYVQLTPVMIEAIKELNNKIENLEKQNLELKASISGIYEMLNKQEVNSSQAKTSK